MPLNVAILEPYYGGSHALFVDTLIGNGRHAYVLATMPARKWKWRMRGAAIHFTRQDVGWIENAPAGGFDAILCSDMLSVSDLRSLLPKTLRDVPIACYFHENQLTYPISRDDPRDFHFAVTNITSCLAADAVWFNSHYHLDAFMEAARSLLARMPDHVPRSALAEIESKSTVLYPSVLLRPIKRTVLADRSTDAPLTIAWCHRWEFDKNPRVFLDALLNLLAEGHSFRVIFLGEQFEDVPPEFAPALDRLQPSLKHVGWLPDRADYLSTLGEADLVVSTAIQENFGYAIIEAILCGCQPLVPDRMAYPEVLGAYRNSQCVFPDDGSLLNALRAVLSGTLPLKPSELADLQTSLTDRFGQSALNSLDEALLRLAR